MKKEFIEALALNVARKRIFSAFPDLRKLDENSIQKVVDRLQKEDIYKMAKETGQDLEELKQIAKKAVETALEELKEKLFKVFDACLF